MLTKAKKEVRIYPAILFKDRDSESVCVSFPDLPGCNTFGEDYEDALTSAKDALGGHLLCMEEDGDDIPAPTPINRLSLNKEEVITLVVARMDILREQEANRSVSKNVTIPNWLNQMASEANINFSSTLQEALKEKLGV